MVLRVLQFFLYLNFLCVSELTSNFGYTIKVFDRIWAVDIKCTIDVSSLFHSIIFIWILSYREQALIERHIEHSRSGSKINAQLVSLHISRMWFFDFIHFFLYRVLMKYVCVWSCKHFCSCEYKFCIIAKCHISMRTCIRPINRSNIVVWIPAFCLN